MPIRLILKALLMPPGGLLVLIAVGWLLRCWRPRLAGGCILGGLFGLWLLSLPVMSEWIARQLETEPPLSREQWPRLARQADAIVVLGAGRELNDPGWGSDQPSLLAVERIRFAARLARVSGLPVAISGGSSFGGPPSEAELMARLMADDYSIAARWLEGNSRTTWENALLSARSLQGSGVRRIVLVTHAWHMPRARWAFEQAGFEVLSAPVGFWGTPQQRPLGGWLADGQALWRSSLLLNEAAGRLLYPLLYSAPAASDS